MPEFLYQYRREQRAEFVIEAENAAAAEKLAEAHIKKPGLHHLIWDDSDDGELELLEGPDPRQLSLRGMDLAVHAAARRLLCFDCDHRFQGEPNTACPLCGGPSEPVKQALAKSREATS